VRPAGVAPARRGGSAVQVGTGFEVRVGLAGAVDVAAETARISKEIGKVDDDLALLERKLSNPSFVERAPAEVVEKDRARVAELREKRSKLDAHRVMLADTETVTATRRHTVENQNEQKPETIPTQVQEAAGQVQTAVAGAVEKVVETATEIAKAASTAVSAQIDRLRKPAKRKAAKKKVARKASARKGPSRKAAKKTAKKKASRKPVRRAAKKKTAKRGKRR